MRTIPILVFAALAAATLHPGDAMTAQTPGAGIAPARDGNIAIRQELDAARKAGTVEAYDLFIARHPGHPLTAAARSERQRLLRQRRR